MSNEFHGMTKTRLYKIWAGINGRCHKKWGTKYSEYGGRGIRVCEEWRESFIAFRDWALANGYTDNLCIDRKNTNGNYEPGNCRFVTYAQNNCNKRRPRTALCRFRGVTKIKSSGKYGASICCDNKRMNLGHFDTDEDAARAYDEAAIRLHGEFASLNSIDDALFCPGAC